MKAWRARWLRLVPAALLAAAAAATAAPPIEMHGWSDVFTGPGAALAWGELRGADDAVPEVFMRIDADPAKYAFVSVTGIDPFGQARRVLLSPTRLSDGFEFTSPRSSFVDYPSTELRFYRQAAEAEANAPALVVYYLGLPDTTPEFLTKAQLEASLAERLASARQERRSTAK